MGNINNSELGNIHEAIYIYWFTSNIYINEDAMTAYNKYMIGNLLIYTYT